MLLGGWRCARSALTAALSRIRLTALRQVQLRFHCAAIVALAFCFCRCVAIRNVHALPRHRFPVLGLPSSHALSLTHTRSAVQLGVQGEHCQCRVENPAEPNFGGLTWTHLDTFCLLLIHTGALVCVTWDNFVTYFLPVPLLLTLQALINWERERHGTGAGCTTVQGFWMPGPDAPLAPGGGPFAGGFGGLGMWGEDWVRPRVSAALRSAGGFGGLGMWGKGWIQLWVSAAWRTCFVVQLQLRKAKYSLPSKENQVWL